MNTKALSTDDINSVFALQREYQWTQRKTTASQRIEKLKQLRNSITKHADEIRQALYNDLQKNAKAVDSGDIGVCYQEIDYAIANLENWMKPKQVESDFGPAQVAYEARGIVLLFGPWNFPFNLVIKPLVQIISAGNCALVKPNEMAPSVSAITSKVIRETFATKEVAVFEGDVNLANQLLELPVDHIFFTGSPAVGKIIMSAAAKHLASVTLELGGKNPVIVDKEANIKDAAGKIAFTRNMNCGQVCICPENIYVHEDIADEFVATTKGYCQAIFYKDGKLNQEAHGKIIDERNVNRVKGYIDDAKAKGANIVCGGDILIESNGIHPTILTNVPSDAKILEEEVFGPVLAIFTYKDINEVYATLHAQPKPLALYIFSENDEFVVDVLANTTSGGVTINNCMAHNGEVKLPFGGVNNSGIGRYHGEYGFRELSNERAILKTK